MQFGSPFNPSVKHPGGCFVCRYFGHRVEGAVWCGRPGGEHVRSQALDTAAVAGLLAASVVILVVIRLWPAAKGPCRVIGIFVDVLAATWAMFFLSNTAVFGVYLFLIFGNGFRYGPVYLYACQALCIVGFVTVLLTTAYWQGRAQEGVGLLFTLIIVPIYVGILLSRLVNGLRLGSGHAR